MTQLLPGSCTRAGLFIWEDGSGSRALDLDLIGTQPRQHRPRTTGGELLDELGQRNAEIMVRQPAERCTSLDPDVCPHPGKMAVTGRSAVTEARLSLAIALADAAPDRLASLVCPKGWRHGLGCR